MRNGQSVPLMQWGAELLEQLAPIAALLDQAHGGNEHALAVALAQGHLQDPDKLPSARVLQAMHKHHGDSFVAFARAQSRVTHQHLAGLPWASKLQAKYEAMATKSVEDQRAIEAADSMPFEIYRQEYISPARLGRPQAQATSLAA
jgi:glutamate--cysteine ligase